MAEKLENTVEIIDKPEVKKESAPIPTKDELVERGWSEKEIEVAEEKGLIKKKEEKKEPAEPKKEEAVKKEEEKPEEKKSSLPDFTFKTPEQEKAFLDAFGPGTPQRAMYFRMKAERYERQKAQEERNKALLKAQVLEDQLKEFQGKPKVEPEIDAEGNEIDPDSKPLTLGMLKEMQKQQMLERQKKEDELSGRAAKVTQALKDQEEFARSSNADYDATVELAMDLIQNLDTLVTDTKTQKKILKLWQDLQATSSNADKLSIEDYNAADISYELGKFHPQYGKSSNGTNADDGKLKDPNKGYGTLTPEQMKRAEQNTQRRASSASVSGGGAKRVVSVEDVTIQDVLKMTFEQRLKFKKDHPEKMAQLLRG